MDTKKKKPFCHILYRIDIENLVYTIISDNSVYNTFVSVTFSDLLDLSCTSGYWEAELSAGP